MPLVLITAAGSALAGFVLGKGTDGISNTVKWVVIGGGLFLVAKKAKYI